MHVIQARNAQQALPMGLKLLTDYGMREESRAGQVLRYPGPVATVLERPQERVIFHAWRDANPFFHLVESMWMLAGRSDLKQLTPYVARMKEFSDDGGVTQPGAYGNRWRGHTSGAYRVWPDQLNWVIDRLRDNPNDRRAVIQMWNPLTDIDAAESNGADVPCNLSMIPWVMNSKLHLSIFNRSNDIIWGLYGANAVHFSVVLEYLAGRLGLGVGTMTTFSNNFHAYIDKVPSDEVVNTALYKTGDPYCSDAKLVEPAQLWDWSNWKHSGSEDTLEQTMQEDLSMLFDNGVGVAVGMARWPFMRHVVVPMVLAHEHYKKSRGPDKYSGALKILEGCAASDWRRAASEWIIRRRDA